MKVVHSIQRLYDSKLLYYKILKSRIDEIIKFNKPDAWHYISRIKAPESFALKIETGRFTKEEIFEDYFACTLVVQNINEIISAIDFIKEHFVFLLQRPHSLNITYKESHSFPFDDLRLYCSYRDLGVDAISEEVLSLKFEVQIKTFLQHAWAIATHDLIYKSELIHWGKERIAYQVKASLEQAEVSISGVNNLCQVTELSKENKITKKVNSVIVVLNRNWNNEDLPVDKRRLAQNIIQLFENLNIPISNLNSLLVNETNIGRGILTKNLSPYLVVVQSLFYQNPTDVLCFLKSRETTKTRLLLTQELELPDLKRIQKDKIIDLRLA